MIDLNRSPIPLYFQIASDLEQQISAGTLSPDEQLRNEKDLAEHYGVSLVTVRSAMRVLLDKGLIVRYAGKGTFVARREDVKNVWSIGSLDEIVASCAQSTVRLLALRQVYPPSTVIERLGIKQGGMAQFIRTLREEAGEPFMVSDQYHAPSLAHSIRKEDFTKPEACTRLVVQVVAERCGVKIGSVRQTMSAELASKEIAELLRLQAGDPLLVVERDYFTDKGSLIQTNKVYYRTDKYRYVINISQVNELTAGRNVYQLPLYRGGVRSA